MKIAIIGASAGVGLETAIRALRRNHTVTTLSRTPISLPFHPYLTVIQGSAVNKLDLKKTINNADAIIVALGRRGSTKPTTLFSEFGRLLIEILRETNADIPIIILSGFGAGDSYNYLKNFIVKLFFKYVLKDVYADKTLLEQIIAETKLKWVIVRPGQLNNNQLTEKYRVENTLFKGINIGSISRADVADFLVKQAENPTEVGKYPALSNK